MKGKPILHRGGGGNLIFVYASVKKPKLYTYTKINKNTHDTILILLPNHKDQLSFAGRYIMSTSLHSYYFVYM